MMFCSPTRRRAFTLIEMITSCAILSLIMLALGYGLKLALVSTGTGAANAASSLDAAEAVARITDDLNEAINFTEKTSQAVTFTVPDRGTDGLADTIRYAWWPTGGSITIPGSGSGGGSGGGGGLLGGLLGGILGGNGDTVITVPQYTLTRQVNGGTVSVLARDVRNFNLEYAYRSMSPAAPATPPDRFLWGHDPFIGIPRDYVLNLDRWFGETFLPSPQLPAGTTSWSITRVALYLRSDGNADSLLRVSLRGVNVTNNWPNNIVYDTAFVPEVSLNDAYGWVEVSFNGQVSLSPTQKYAIVVEGNAGTSNFASGGYVQSGSPIPTSTWLVTTANRGGIWATTNASSLRYKIYGTTTP